DLPSEVAVHSEPDAHGRLAAEHHKGERSARALPYIPMLVTQRRPPATGRRPAVTAGRTASGRQLKLARMGRPTRASRRRMARPGRDRPAAPALRPPRARTLVERHGPHPGPKVGTCAN